MKKKGCAASRAEQKLRFQENLDTRVCEAHFCSTKDTSIGQPHEEREGMTTSVRLDSVYDDFCRRWDHVRR